MPCRLPRESNRITSTLVCLGGGLSISARTAHHARGGGEYVLEPRECATLTSGINSEDVRIELCREVGERHSDSARAGNDLRGGHQISGFHVKIIRSQK